MAFAFQQNAKHICIAGMDGYTLHSKKELKTKKSSQHCYGKGYTDDCDWDKCVQKDSAVQSILDEMKLNGIDFNIITPTVFKNHRVVI